MALLSANIILCETVLNEQQIAMPSAIRMMDSIRLARGSNYAHFFAVTRLSCQPGDFQQHALRITVTDSQAQVVSSAPVCQFHYGYAINAVGPGGFILTTEFQLDVSALSLPATCLINAYLDGEYVAHTPLMLSR